MERQFKGVADCFSQTLRQEGLNALFKGAVARVLVIAPLFAIAQMVYFLGVGERIIRAVGGQNGRHNEQSR